MKSVWFTATYTLIGYATLAFLSAALFGASYGWAVLSVLLLASLHAALRNMSAFLSWLRNPQLTNVPDGTGDWEYLFSALNRYVRRQSATHHRLAGLLLRYRNAGQALPDGVTILDLNSHIEWMNPTAAEHLGLDPEQDRGQPISNLIRTPDFVAYLDQRSFDKPLRLKAPRGGTLILSLRFIPFGQSEMVLLSRDITRFEAVDTMRRDFVANVSHELRTPLTVLGGFLETLCDPTIKLPRAQMLQYVNLMREHTGKMQHLVEDLLTLSSLEYGSPPPNETCFLADPLISAVRAEVAALSAGRHKLSFQAVTGLSIVGSEKELHSAFSNLLSNAVRYTPEGGAIDLSWQLEAGDATFSVRDSGIGIEADDVPRLTERFFRVDRGRSRESGGTGLGLAIVKHVVTRHQAQLEIESEPARGSCFRVRLPKARIRVSSADKSVSELV